MPLMLATCKEATLKGSRFHTGVEEMFREEANNRWKASESIAEGERSQRVVGSEVINM